MGIEVVETRTPEIKFLALTNETFSEGLTKGVSK